MKVFHLWKEIYFPSAKNSRFLCTPFLIADLCQQLVLGGSEDSTGDKSGAMSQVLIVPFLHWKVVVKIEKAEAETSSNDFQTLESGLYRKYRGDLSSLTKKTLGESRAVEQPKAGCPDGRIAYSLHTWMLRCVVAADVAPAG